MTGHFVCGVDSPFNVIGLMKQENQIVTVKLVLQQERCVEAVTSLFNESVRKWISLHFIRYSPGLGLCKVTSRYSS
jgi:hypothetical protein